jgi:hypothetical protein
MLRACVRFFAVALLVLAIPLQGMAAVTAGQCMAVGHHQDGAGQDTHAHDGADAGDQAAHAHPDGSAAEQGDDGGKKPQCGPCTACCASASIAGPAGLAVFAAASHAPYLFWQFPPIGVAPDGFDRPPLAL